MKGGHLFVCAIVAGLLAGSGRAEAGSVLVFQGQVTGTSIVSGALTLSGATSTLVTTDSATFNSQLASGNWDVVIYAEQENDTYEDSDAELAAYLAGGGKLIGFTYRTDGLRGLLDSDYHVSTNPYILDNDPVHPIFQTPYPLTTDGAPLNSFVGAHGHTTAYSHGWHPASGATGLGNVNFGGYQAILGNSGNSILNATLTDTYDTLSEGERLLANEILFLEPTIAAPEPSSVALLVIAGLSLLWRRPRAGKTARG